MASWAGGGDFLGGIRDAHWWDILGLLCCIGLLITLIGMIPVLWLMQRNLKNLGDEFGSLNEDKRDRENDQDAGHDD
jgi:hypothetical protein